MTAVAAGGTCTKCEGTLDALGVCGRCGWHSPLGAQQRIEQLVDRGSFRETERHLRSGNPLHFTDGVSSYEELAASAQATTGLVEAVVTGRAEIVGSPAVLAAFDFRFMGGSMGSGVGEKLARAFELARRERLPAIVICASGGARIQEGMVALFQMAKTALFAARLRESGVPLITVLADPTMGGVLASFGSLGDVILAEPGARIAFVGPRVHHEVVAGAAPEGTAEAALGHGMVDAVVPRAELRLVLGRLASMLRRDEQPKGRRSRLRHLPVHRGDDRPVWEIVELARHPDRPSGRQLLHGVFGETVELHGDRCGEDDESIVVAIARLGGRVVVAVGQDRHAANGGRTRPSGYRKAQRAFTLAERFNLPLITLVDTPGAATDAEAEAGGITAAVAESLARLGRLRTRILNVVVGEGGSGGALALSTGDRLLMMENAIFSVIGPEAASTILYHDREHAKELATRLKLTAPDLLDLHIIDRVVPEQPPGHESPGVMAAMLRQCLMEELDVLERTSIKELLERREARYRQAHAVKGRRPLFSAGWSHEPSDSSATPA